MAKQLSYVVNYPSGSSETYAQSYWRCSLVCINKEDAFADIHFRGYPSAALKGSREIGLKQYRVSGADYAAWFAPAVLQAADVDPIKLAYLYADQCHDKLAAVQPTPTEDNPTPAPVYESFFAGATDV